MQLDKFQVLGISIVFIISIVAVALFDNGD